ncbi:MAG: efflux RND transporter periplasmic adaptor subunit [Spirochaetales bacterium]|nr:efflux RND transporter periplasmic adaptor subunit [Spirochaetales bacterium]
MKLHRFGLFAFLVLTGCSEPPQTPRIGVPTVHVVHLDFQTMTPEVKSFGSLSFAHKAELTSVVAGTVVSPLPEEGRPVVKDQVLCVLQNDQITIQQSQARHEFSAAKAGVELAEAKLWQARLQFETRRLSLTKTENQLQQKKLELEEAQKILEGKEKLYELSGVSKQELETLRLKVLADKTDLEALNVDFRAQQIGLRDADILAFGLKVASNKAEKGRILENINTTVERAELDSARANLEKAQGDVDAASLLAEELTVRSPLSGILGARYVEQGEHLTQGNKIATVFDDTAIDAVVPVREEEGLALRVGQSAQVWIDALGSTPFRGFVRVISPIVDPTSGHFTVKVRLQLRDVHLKPGLFVRVTIPYGTAAQFLVLPQETLMEKRNDTARVLTVVNLRLIERRVTLGKEVPNGWVVTAGVNAGDVLVKEPSPLLREGDRVEISS